MRGVYEVLSVIKEWIDKRDFYSIENFYRELKRFKTQSGNHFTQIEPEGGGALLRAIYVAVS